MKNLKVLATAFTLVGAMLVALTGSVIAGSPGQLAGGDNYLVKNVTQGTSYSNSVSASCGDVLQYSMQISNTHFGALNNVTIKASLPSGGGTSTAVVTTDLGGTSGTSDTVSATLPAGATQTLQNGTTILYDGSANVIKTLPNTITTGVNIGTLTGSTTEYVNFRVKVDCPTPVVSTAECSEVALSMVGDSRKVNVTVNTTVNNATIVAYKVDYGDGFVATTKDSSHTYAQDGTYNIVASVQAKYADGSTKWITSDNCKKKVTITTEVPEPVYSCDLMAITAVNENRKVTINMFTVTAKDGATYKHTVITWGDGTETTTSDVEGQTHSYAKDGTYTVKAVAYFTLSDGTVVSDASEMCASTVKFENEQPPVVTPPTPTTPTPVTPKALPKTGAGSIAAIFGGVTALSTLGYSVVTRRLSRQ